MANQVRSSRIPKMSLRQSKNLSREGMMDYFLPQGLGLETWLIKIPKRTKAIIGSATIIAPIPNKIQPRVDVSILIRRVMDLLLEPRVLQ